MASTSVTVTLNPASLARFRSSPDGAIGLTLARILNTAANNARVRANVDTGLMRSSIGYDVDPTTPVSGRLYARTRYARYVHDGTRYYAGNPFLSDGLRDALR